ncbi:hypothetical protein [Prochlorococcus marinus]|uniref:hypothetical protein n=1 Tax=Prochlorococcus TaxID=1218 RepID=UPI0007B3A72A|nr:hypothetical protein [Prochlorococcus marinus]KZR75472.1 hypothetical protein PMIT1323_01763 [Prochlorococcus marinus str. MIT 1323]
MSFENFYKQLATNPSIQDEVRKLGDSMTTEQIVSIARKFDFIINEQELNQPIDVTVDESFFDDESNSEELQEADLISISGGGSRRINSMSVFSWLKLSRKSPSLAKNIKINSNRHQFGDVVLCW